MRFGVGECLFKFDDNMVPQPWLAESAETEDYQTWVVTLKKGIKFSDGCDLTPSKVAAAYQRLKDEGPNGSTAPQKFLPYETEITADDAANTMVALSASNNLVYFYHMAFDGVFDPITGIWNVGTLPANTYTQMLLAMSKIAPGPSYIEAVVVSDSFDPNLSNNYDIAYFGLESASASEETLPATGNPLVVALLALFVIGVGGLKRRL